MKYYHKTIIILMMAYAEAANTGKFWHISDHHLDPYYDPTATDPIDICPSSYGRSITDPGPLGDYNCDSPWTLIQSSVDAMKNIEPSPDFILWTGDDSLHTSNQTKYLGKEKVLYIIGNISMTIANAFPDTVVFPALGNHDYDPKSQIPPGGSEILTDIAEIWKPWLTADAYTTFEAEGYYMEFINNSSDHFMMILNSNFWYTSNKQVDGSGDPAGQFEWMENILKDAADNSRKVFIAGHVPPGYCEQLSTTPKRWFYADYNDRFLSIVEKYQAVISGMFFGHQHTDTFRVIKDTDGNIIQSMLLAPAVTPWATTLTGVENGSNNPGIRLVEYDRDSLELKDFTQYYLDLVTANLESQSDFYKLWKEEYTATTTYGINDVTTPSLGALATAMRSSCESDDSDCSDYFTKYVKLNTVSYNLAPCDETCQKYQLCAMTEVDFANHDSCMKNWGNHGEKAAESSSFAMLMAIIWMFFHFHELQ